MRSLQKLLLSFATLSCLAFPPHISANQSIEEIKQKARTLGLAERRQWLHLLHFPAGRHSRSSHSEIDDREFFLAEDGYKNPEDELFATIDALMGNSKFPDMRDSNSLTKCIFPARTAWLARELDLDPSLTSLEDCTTLANWLKQFDAKQLTLVFPSYYLDRASSMFGHLFLRVDSSSRFPEADLLSPTINFAADTSGDNVIFENYYRGIFSGYPGELTIEPYFMRLRKYVDNEHRDIWSYKIKISDAQLHFFLLHVWEIQGKKFEYYFLDENCAYRILTLLQVPFSEQNLDRSDYFTTLPLDVIRTLEKHDLIEPAKLTPSQISDFRVSTKHLSREEKKLVKTIVDDQIELTEIPDHLLPIMYDYQAIRTRMDLGKRSQNAQRLHSIIKERRAREDFGKNSSLKSGHEPPDSSHEANRISISALEYPEQNSAFFGLSYRYLLHDLTDRSAGYQKNTQLSFLEATILGNENTFLLSKLKLLEISSLPPSDDFFANASWLLSLGGENPEPRKRRLVGYFNLGLGLTRQLDFASLSVIPIVTVKDKNLYEESTDYGAGLKIILLSNKFSRSNLKIDVSQVSSNSNFYDSHRRVNLDLNMPLQKNFSVFLNLDKREDVNSKTQSDSISKAQIGSRYYF